MHQLYSWGALARLARTNRLPARWARLLGVLALLLSSTGAWAQLTGSKAIPGSGTTGYPTLAAAIADLNTQGVGAGGVTFNVTAGYTETFASPTAGAITATGTSANPIVFQKAGTGANPVITAGVGTSTTADAVISLAGSDYVTFSSIDLLDPTSNATATTAMEFGFLLGRTGTGATLDGTNNNTIRGCAITLQRAYGNTTTYTPYGIFSTAGTVAVPFTALSATSATAAGQSSGNTFASNTIQNVSGGIYLQGLADATPYINYDQGNTVGGSSAALGNTISNFGGVASVNAYGVRMTYQNNIVATYNTISNAAGGGVASVGTIYGIYVPSGTNTTSNLSRNVITLTQAANASQVAGIYNSTGGTGTLTMDYNTLNLTATASTGSFYGLYNSGAFSTTSGTVLSASNNTFSYTATGAASNSFYALYNSGVIAGTTAVNNNTFLNAANPVASTGALAFFYNPNSSTGTINFQSNQWTLNRTGASGTVYGYYNGSAPTGEHVFTSNNFSNITLAGSSTFYGFYVLTTASQPQTIGSNTMTNVVGGSGTTAPLYIAYGAGGSTISNNTVTNVSGTGTVYGVYTGSNFYGGSLNGNVVGNVSSSGASSTAYGLYLSANTATTAATLAVYANKVYGISSSGATGSAYGAYVSSTGTYNVYNNLIGGITAPASSNSVATAGLYISTGTTITAYYNTIYLTGSSTASGFGSAGVYANTTPTLTLTDNIIVNNSTATGTGVVAAYRRSGTTLTTYAAASNNNLLYGGNPGNSQVIFTDGTNTYVTLAAYKTAMATRDQQSVTELPTFASLNGPDATFLHFAAGQPTQAEGGGIPVSGITNDYDGDTRNATTPDIGADEGSFAAPVAITVTGATYTQNNTPTGAGQTNQQVTGVVIAATGQTNPPVLNSITFNLGSTSLGNVSNAKLYASGNSTFSLASATLVPTTGTVASPSFTLTLTTPLPLASGNNYFYLTYDIPVSATPGATVATTATAVNVGGTTYTPTLSGPAGSRTILGALVGTYYITGTVGSSPDPTKEFATLTAAAAAYGTRGLGGAVTFALRDATYSTAETFPITFNNNPAASATNTLTIRPDAGVSPTITGSSAGALLTLNGATYVTLDGSNAGTTTQNLTLSNTNTGGSAALVLLTSDASNVVPSYDAVRNTVLTGAASTTTFTTLYGIRMAVNTGATAGATNNAFSNNAITRVQTGISVVGLSTTVRDANTSITGNQIGSATAAAGFGGATATGISASNQNTLTITGNVVRNPVIVAAGANSSTGTALLSVATLLGIDLGNVTTATVANNTVRDLLTSGSSGATSPAAGIRLGSGVTATTVNANLVTNVKTTAAGGYGAYGIYVNTATASVGDVVSNNMVSDINGSNYSAFTNSSSAGIYLNGTQSGISIVYNSVNIYGTSTYGTTTAVATAGLAVESGSTALTVQNNVLSNSLVANTTAGAPSPGAKPYAFFSNAPAAAYTVLNNNDYYSAGVQAADAGGTATTVVVYFGSSARYSLADVRTATTQDAASISVDPQFAAPNDLHTFNSALAVGAPVTGITTDFDGETRSTTTPYIGADENPVVSVDAQPTALVAPATTTTCYSNAETVTVRVRNGSTTTPLSFATNPLTVTVNVTGPVTQSFTTTISSNAGNPGGTALAPNATVDVTLPGTLNMTAAGTYTFAITASVTGDQNPNNNTLTATRTVVAPALTSLSTSTTSLCGTGNSVTLTANGAVGGTVTFYSSANNYTTPIGTGSSLTVAVAATTSFQARVVCGSNQSAASNTVTVTVNNPQVASTNGPVTVCSGSTATITATASTGSSIRFYDVATGGTPLTTTTAGSYTTPALTASTTYYAEAYTGGTETVGKPTSGQTDGGYSGSNTGLVFTTTGALTLQSTTVYNATTTAGSVSVELRDNASGNLIATAGPFAVPAGSTTALIPTVLSLNLAVPAAGTYRLVTAASPTPPTLYRDFSGNTYPYTSPSGQISITGGYISGASATYYFFYNIVVGNECVNGTRTAIQVNVTQPATASFPNATATTCGTAPYQLAGTVGGGATTGTYTSSGTGTFAPNATTLNATYTPSAADVTAGSVTITLTAAAAGGCAATPATLTLTISRAPLATFSYPTTTACAGGTGTVAPTLGTGATAGTFTASPAGLTINATTGAVTLSSSAAGTYTITNTVAASGACAAVTATATLTVSPAPATPTLTPTGTSATGITLTSSATIGNQFYLNGVLITGATGQTYVVNSGTRNGTYTVIVTNANGCSSAASAPVTVTVTATALAQRLAVSLHPNPTPTGQVTLELSGARPATELTVLDAVGRVVLTRQLPAGSGTATFGLDLSSQASGVYVLRLRNADGVLTRRITRE